MRPFEILLVLVNVLSLLPLFNKQSKRIWFGIACVNLVVLGLHSVVEGVRYQMAGAYLTVLLLVWVALTTTRGWKAKIPTLLKGFALLLLIATSFLAYALPVFSLPQPTGDYAIGVTYLHLVDENRTEPFLEGSTQPRELMVKIYYPAEQDDSQPAAAYFDGNLPLVRAFTAHYMLPDFVFDHLALVKTHARKDLQVSATQERYPIVLYSHGGGTSMETQTAQGEALASHGYVVVAIDHPYASFATAFPDRLVSEKEATTNFNSADPAELITQIMAEDVQFVIDELEGMNAGTTPSRFEGRLDLDHMGAMGHSVGGAVDYNLLLNDSRIRAAINVDGTVYVTPTVAPEAAPPFLMLANDQFHVQALQTRTALMQDLTNMSELDREIALLMYGSEELYQVAYEKAQANMTGLTSILETSGNLYTIAGCDHMKFVDIGMFIGFAPLRETLAIKGQTAPEQCVMITNRVSVAFFDEYLKGDSTSSVESLPTTYPELSKVPLP